MAALLLSAGWAPGETCMQLTPSGWKEREDRKEDYLLTGLKEKIGTFPLLNGGMWKPEDIVPPEGNVACGDKFLLPESEVGRERWILMDREGNECAHLNVYLFESERMARKEFILKRESFSQLGDLVVWGKEHVWNVEVDEAFQTVTLKKDKTGEAWMMADREWEIFERVNKPFQCDLPDVPALKKEDIHVSAFPFRLRNLFMVPNVENGSVTSWKLINREGYETANVEIFLGSSPGYLRTYLRTNYQVNCSRVMDKSWMMDRTAEGGIWCMYYTQFYHQSVFLALRGNLALMLDTVSDGEQLRFHVEDVQELFRLLLGEKKYEVPGEDLKLALEKGRQRDAIRRKEMYQEGREPRPRSSFSGTSAESD